MAGGKGSRMILQEEKLLLKYKKPIILNVIDALRDSKSFSKIIAVTSFHSPKTREILQNSEVEIFETPGKGYVDDLNLVLRTLKDEVLVVPGDLPLLDGEIVSKIISSNNLPNIWISYLVTKAFLNSLGLKSEYSTIFKNKECIFTGISRVKANQINDLSSVKETHYILDDKRIAFNLNTKEDYNLLCSA